MNWLFLVLLAFCILGVIRGACKGLVRMAVSLVFLVLVFVLASVINAYVSSFIRDNTELYRTFTESCSDMIEDRMEEAGDALTLNAQVQIIDELPLPKTVKDGLLKNTTAMSYKKLSADKFADYVAAYVGNLLLCAVAFLLSFVLALILMQIFLHVTDLLTALPVISQINFAGGALLGFVWAMIFIGLFFILASLLSGTGFGQMVQAAVQESASVRWFYDHNMLWLLIEVFLGL